MFQCALPFSGMMFMLSKVEVIPVLH